MEKFFRYLGHKAGPSIRKGRWVYNTFFADKKKALESEYLVGRELSSKLEKDLQLLTQPEVQSLVLKIGEKLYTRVTNKDRKFKFQIISSNDLNAFALPGGFIYITAALLKLHDFNEDEIAFILAHEMVHVVLKHPLNHVLSSYSLKMIENLVRTRSGLGQLTKHAVVNLLQKGYSRENELAADRYATQLMASAGFNAKAAVTALNKLRLIKSGSEEVFNFFSTHPPLTERIAQINAQIYKS